MIPADLVTMGVAFYDIQRTYGLPEWLARLDTVNYMRRKVADDGDTMPWHEALANALALRASARIQSEGTDNVSSCNQ